MKEIYDVGGFCYENLHEEIKFQNQRNCLEPAHFKGGDLKIKEIYDGYRFHYKNMHREINFEYLRNLAGPSIIDGGDSRMFLIYGLNGFRCVNKREVH